MVVQPSKEAYEALINEVKALKEENKRLRNEKKDTGRSPAEVELQPKTRDRNASRNSWANIYSEATAMRRSTMLLGQELQIDDGLEWRVKCGQRGAGIFFLLGVICWVSRQELATILVAALALTFLGIVYYKNVSFVIVKRLLREPTVVIMVVLGLCILVINIAEPSHSLEPPLGLIYLLCVNALVFLDAVKVKSRVFMIIIGVLFVSVNINNIYNLIFGDWDQGVVLFKYTVQGNKYTFMKRSVKRSIFIQIVLFSMNGIYTIFKDRKQELMIFATGHIYRETGTASKEVEDKQYTVKIKSEKSISV